ncbi:hypothetical protein SRHO_G00077690 [Serrasalmus rhombeus]
MSLPLCDLVGECPMIQVSMDGVAVSCLLDTGSQVSMMRQDWFEEHFGKNGQRLRDTTSWLKLRAANGKEIPYLGYVTLQVDIAGVGLENVGVIVIRNSCLTVSALVGMNIIKEVWQVLFQKSAPHDVKNVKKAMHICQKEHCYTSPEGFVGYTHLASRHPVTVPGNREVLLNCRARNGACGRSYEALMEPLPIRDGLLVARTLVNVKNGQMQGLKLKPDKCKLLRSSVQYLGHVVSDAGIAPDPDKVMAVQQWKVPKSATELQAFLGLAGYYRRFVKGFSQIAAPLHKLLGGHPAKKSKAKALCPPWNWSNECGAAFESLKQGLVQAPVLAFADFTLPFLLYTDARHRGLGAVPSQKQGGQEKVIAYASRGLQGAERNDANYSSFKLELLALKWAITEKFHEYLLGSDFTVYTDNNPLAHLATA